MTIYFIAIKMYIANELRKTMLVVEYCYHSHDFKILIQFEDVNNIGCNLTWSYSLINNVVLKFDYSKFLLATINRLASLQK